MWELIKRLIFPLMTVLPTIRKFCAVITGSRSFISGSCISRAENWVDESQQEEAWFEARTSQVRTQRRQLSSPRLPFQRSQRIRGISTSNA